MEKMELVERAKMYLKLLGDGLHPVTGEEIPNDSAFMDEKVKRCFAFISEVLDEYIELSAKVDEMEKAKKAPPVVIAKKQEFSVTAEQCDNIKLSKEPLTMMAFTKNINSVIDADIMEKMTSTRINKWLLKRGLFTVEQVPTVVTRNVNKPSNLATKIGIVEESVVDKRSGEIKTQIKLSEAAQLFIIENLTEIIEMT